MTHPARHLCLNDNFEVRTPSPSSSQRRVSRSRNDHTCFPLTISSCEHLVRLTTSGGQIDAEMSTPTLTDNT